MIKKIIRLYIYAHITITLMSTCAGYCNAYDIDEESSYSAEKYYKQGVALSTAKSYEKAIEAFEQSLTYNPNLSDAYYNMASIYVTLGKYEEAFTNYVKAFSVNPYDYDSIIQAAKIAYNKKNYSVVMKYLKYIPEDAVQYSYAMQLYNDASELFNLQKNKIERSKTTTARVDKKVLTDKLNAPAGIAVDSEGNMYVASYGDNAIVKIDKNKNKKNFVKDYLLEGPVGIAIDAYDNLYVANYDADNILKITKGGNVSIFMKNISKPYFLYIKNDILYISEQGNDVVVKYNLGN